MECIILAAGKGTRLKELTEDVNKCTISIDDKPIIKRIVDNFKSNNINNINIITGHCSDSIKNIIGSSANYIHNPLYAYSGILVSLLAGKKVAYNKKLLISTGDIIFHDKIIPKFLAQKGEVIIAVKKKFCDEKDVKVVVENNEIIMFEENYPAEKAVGEFGMMALLSEKASRAIFDIAEKLIIENNKARLIDAFNEMIKQNYEFIPYCFEENLAIEIDTLEDIEKAHDIIKNFELEDSHELTTIDKVKKYLENKNLFINPNIEFVDIGNINYVYKISDKEKKLYLKYYGKEPRRTTEAINSIGYQPSRFENEIEAIKCLQETLDAEKAESIPQIYHYDYKNRVLILTDIADNNLNLKELLLSNFNTEKLEIVMENLAKLIAQQHAKTIKKEILDEDKEFNKRFYDFRTIQSAINLNNEEQEKIKQRAEEILKNNKDYYCLINADLSPKQIFVKNDKIGLCDFELVSSGIASYDIGFFIANLKIIEIIKNDNKIGQLIDRFLECYFRVIKEELNEPNNFIEFTKENINFFIGTGILNRIDAVPLEPHIPEEYVEKLREIAREYIFNCSSS